MTNETSDHCHTIDESICEMTGVKVENHITDPELYYQQRAQYAQTTTAPVKKSRIMIGNGNLVEFDFNKGTKK
ncbi:hypothetical protein [Francisella philomiragia]|uniref:hypothetical protein n=1 Tax=Francisella philomiragia TaxID=28110 RepID=UPI002243C0AD|nr:hypothetical protein [Francisella philomiragia]